MIGEAEGHTHDVDQAEASTLLCNLMKASIASAELEIPRDMPEVLLDLSNGASYAADG